ncbi:hypothetical protein NXW62_05250 [Bacteroides fragilis]|nr:hypothetical protein [Bacteroides fragilis]MCS3046527.1 hypothetical protein [Bacteroides fragilis]MCS3164282.1 hypothetical protein [Bacteroides fragilis]
MQKISSISALIAVFLMFFASCTNEELIPNEPDRPVLNQGRVVFNVNTGKSTVYTRASVDDEQAIRSLGVFIVKPDGNLAEGITRFYEAEALTDKKLAVSIPVDIMETPGIKAYLVANGPDKTQCDGLKTEQELLDLAAVIKPEEIGTKGIPMASGAISLNFTGGIATVDANMKRVMSTLCAKVVKSKGVVVGPSDFTFKVHGVSLKEGYCFKDECKDTGVDQVWNSTSKSQDEEVSLGYFYQSKAFQVEVVSQSAGQSRTIEIPLEKAQTRNKKYVLNIHPKPASEGKGEFTVTVEAWEETEADVDFDKLSIKKDLPADKFEIQNDGIRLLTNNYHETDFGSPKDWFVLKEGTEIVNVKFEGTIDGEKRGVNLNEKGIACATSRLNQTDLSGKIIVTMKDKNGIITQEDCAIYVSHAYAQWKPNYVYDFGGGITSAVIDGVFVQTNYGKGTGIANFNVVNILLGKVVSVCPAFVSSSNPEEGVLYDSEGKEVSDISFKADGSSSSLSLTATFKRGEFIPM